MGQKSLKEKTERSFVIQSYIRLVSNWYCFSVKPPEYTTGVMGAFTELNTAFQDGTLDNPMDVAH